MCGFAGSYFELRFGSLVEAMLDGSFAAVCCLTSAMLTVLFSIRKGGELTIS